MTPEEKQAFAAGLKAKTPQEKAALMKRIIEFVNEPDPDEIMNMTAEEVEAELVAAGFDMAAFNRRIDEALERVRGKL